MQNDPTPASSEGAPAPPDSPPLSDVPAPAREVLSLFAGPLAGVRFPDVDADALGALAQEVAARAATLEDARQALQRARAGLEESQRAILSAADKGLAYARVFTGGQGELGERVEQLLAARASAKAPRRGRRRKRAGSSPDAQAAAPAAPGSPVTELPLAGVA